MIKQSLFNDVIILIHSSQSLLIGEVVMQIPENPSNDDIRQALIQLREELGQKVDRLEYKFDAD